MKALVKLEKTTRDARALHHDDDCFYIQYRFRLPISRTVDFKGMSLKALIHLDYIDDNR